MKEILRNHSIVIYIKILLLHAITIPSVVVIFKFIEEKKIAGALAAGLFILSAMYILLTIRKIPDYYAKWTYWFISIQLTLIALPMFLARLIFWTTPFNEIHFIFFSGADFHKFSEKVYLLLIASTFVDLTYQIYKIKKGKGVV
jgi:hypothetical protein